MLFHFNEKNIEKETLVFIHGFLGSHLDWEKYMIPFKNEYNIITLNLPGHGDTPFYQIENLLEWLPKGCHLITYSLGGRIALRLMKKNPTFFSSGVIISSHIGLEKEEEKNTRRLIENEWITLLQNAPLTLFLEKWYKQPLFNGFEIPNRRYDQDTSLLARALTEFGLSTQEPFWDFIKNTTTPLTFLYGEKDEHYRPIYEKIKASCPHPIFLIEEASHAIPLEKEDLCIKQIQNHLNRWRSSHGDPRRDSLLATS